MTTATELKLAAALRLALADLQLISDENEGSHGKTCDAILSALASYEEPADHSDMLRSMNLAEANWWFIENISADDPMRDTYYWLLRERNAEGCSESDTLDSIAHLMDGEEWDADTLDAIANLIRESGRDVHGPNEEG